MTMPDDNYVETATSHDSRDDVAANAPAVPEIINPVTSEPEEQEQETAQEQFTREEMEQLIEKRLARAERQAQRLRAERSAATGAAAAREVNISDYATFEDYQAALVEARVEQTLAQREAKLAEQQQEYEQQQNMAQLEARAERVYQAAIEANPDFELHMTSITDTLQASGLGLQPDVIESIIESPSFADIVTFFGDNPNHLETFAELRLVDQVKALAQFEQAFQGQAPTKQQQRPISRAPAPPRPIKQGSSVVNNPENMSMDEFLAREKQRGAAYIR